jgi:hypothetical protein
MRLRVHRFPEFEPLVSIEYPVSQLKKLLRQITGISFGGEYALDFLDGDIPTHCQLGAIRQPNKEILRVDTSDINRPVPVAVKTPDVAKNTCTIFAVYSAHSVSEPLVQTQREMEAATTGEDGVVVAIIDPSSGASYQALIRQFCAHTKYTLREVSGFLLFSSDSIHDILPFRFEGSYGFHEN